MFYSFYASRFMTALAELEGPIVHQNRSDEDAMFDSVKQGKGKGIKPEEAALSYFIAQVEHSVLADPERWKPMLRKATRRVKVWIEQKKVCQQYAEMYFDLVQSTKAN